MQQDAKTGANASDMRGQAKDSVWDQTKGSSSLRSADTSIQGDYEHLPAREELGESRQSQAEVAALLVAARAVLSHREFKPAVRAILDSCMSLTGATTAYVTLLSEDETEKQVLFLDADGAVCSADPSLSTADGELGRKTYQNGQAVYQNHFCETIRMQFMPSGQEDIRNLLIAPLSINRVVVGLLGLGNKPDGFSDNDASMASAFGELAAIALLNSRTLASLQNGEERFRAVAQTANDAIVTVDGGGIIVFWNRAAETIFGYSPDQAIGQPLAFAIPGPFDAAHHGGLERLVSTAEPQFLGNAVELVGLRSDGRRFPIELSLSTWKSQERVFFTAIIRDITERVRARALLQEQKEFIVNAIEALSHPFYVIDALDYTIKMANSAAYRGELPESATCHALNHQQSTPCSGLDYPCPLEEIRKTQQPVVMEHIHIDSDGRRGYFEVHGHPVFDSSGSLTHIIEYTLDVTERRLAEEALREAHRGLELRIKERTAELARANLTLQAEIARHVETTAALRESEERYRRLVELSFEAIVIHVGGKLVYINPVGAHMLGAADAQELIGKSIRDFVHPGYWKQVQARVRQASEEGKDVPLVEEKLLRLDGTPIDVEAAGIPIMYDGRPAVQTVIRDTTARKRAAQERELERTRLARDLHDSLGHNLGYLHLKLDQLAGNHSVEDAAELRRELAQMRDVVDEAYELVRGMLAALLPSGSSDLVTAMRQQAQLIGERGDFKVRVTSEGEAIGLTPILQQQVLYIFQEALVNVERHAGAGQVHIALLWTKDCLTIAMADDGCGFEIGAVQTQGHFGLGIMQERADEINGQLTLTSRPGSGTEVTLQLPLATNNPRGTTR